MLEDEKQAFTSVSASDGSANSFVVSPLAIELNERGVKKAIAENNYKEALTLFRRAVEIDSGCFQCTYNLGRSLLETGSLDEAVEVFSKLTKSKPDYAAALFGLADAFGMKENYTEAVPIYTKGLEIDEKDAISHCNLAISLHKIKKYEQALQHFDSAIKYNPNLVEAYNNKGASLFALGRYKDALKNLQKADSLKPNSAEILNNIGTVFDVLGKKKQAHEYFLEAVRLQPDYKFGIYNLALSYLDRGDRDAAQQQLKSLESIDFSMAAQLRKEIWKKFVVDVSEVKSGT